MRAAWLLDPLLELVLVALGFQLEQQLALVERLITRARTSSRWNGLARNRARRAGGTTTALFTSATPVTMMTAVSGQRAMISRSSATPSISGMSRSEITSGTARSAFEQRRAPPSPDPASRQVKPSL